MSAATCPTSFLSTPWIVIFVLSATVILMFSGIENRTGCEKPRLKLRIDPCTAALKPTPSISSCLANPSLTPCTMLCTRLRESPCKAFAHQGHPVVLHARFYVARELPVQFSLRPFDRNRTLVVDLDLDLIGNLDRF